MEINGKPYCPRWTRFYKTAKAKGATPEELKRIEDYLVEVAPLKAFIRESDNKYGIAELKKKYLYPDAEVIK